MPSSETLALGIMWGLVAALWAGAFKCTYDAYQVTATRSVHVPPDAEKDVAEKKDA